MTSQLTFHRVAETSLESCWSWSDFRFRKSG